MNKPPKEPPHIVLHEVAKLAETYGYYFREAHLVCYVGKDEYLTICKQSNFSDNVESGA